MGVRDPRGKRREFKFDQDEVRLEDFKIEFKGVWNRARFDQMVKLAKRELMKYKTEVRRKEDARGDREELKRLAKG